jgi:CRP-like cAMP-binding protein
MKLEQFRDFKKAERQRLDEFISGRRKTWKPKQDIISEGDHVDNIHLVTCGLAARYKILENGERQIMAFLVPGDLCDLEVFVLKRWIMVFAPFRKPNAH